MSMQVKNLSKSYDEITLYKDFNLELQEGEITCILGPSGCGKTTLLNIIAQTLSPEAGQLLGFDHKIISYIFQEPRLLPWRTVRGNIELVLGENLPKAERNSLVDRFIRLVELDGFARSNLNFIRAGEVRQQVQAYLNVFYNMNPEIIGGRMPDEEFYHTQ